MNRGVIISHAFVSVSSPGSKRCSFGASRTLQLLVVLMSIVSLCVTFRKTKGVSGSIAQLSDTTPKKTTSRNDKSLQPRPQFMRFFFVFLKFYLLILLVVLFLNYFWVCVWEGGGW